MAKKKITKAIIENSIEIVALGAKTVFTVESEEEKSDYQYKPLTNIKGRTLTVTFKYSENDVEVAKSALLTLPKEGDEAALKAFILDELNKTL